MLASKGKDAAMIIDYDYDPLADADTGRPHEFTHEEIEAMLKRDEDYHRFLEHHKEVLIVLHKILDHLDREVEEETGNVTSMLREKVLRGVNLSDEEIPKVLFGEVSRFIFEKITPREFLRRMTIVSQLVDLDRE
jgi:hypothetical protein